MYKAKNKPLDEAWARELDARMKALRISPTMLASAIGVSTSTVTRWFEPGEKEIRIENENKANEYMAKMESGGKTTAPKIVINGEPQSVQDGQKQPITIICNQVSIHLTIGRGDTIDIKTEGKN